MLSLFELPIHSYHQSKRRANEAAGAEREHGFMPLAFAIRATGRDNLHSQFHATN